MHFNRYIIIDTSGYQPFLAYVDHQRVLQHWPLPVGSDQGPVLDFIFQTHTLPFQGIGVATGPGNFSATRLGLSFAQGLALSKRVPIVGYSSLEGYLVPGDREKAMMLPLGRKGGVLTLSSDVSNEGMICGKSDGVGPGMLLSYSEASEYCLEHGYYHVVSPRPQLFAELFSEKITLEEVAPSLDHIRRLVVSQLMLSECAQLIPDYRSCSCFF